MLRQLLRLAVGRGTERTSELARELGITPALANVMLEQLEHQGYLRAVVPGCSAPCEGCQLHASCPSENHPRVWALTEKGAHLSAPGT